MRTQTTLQAPLPMALLCPDCGATVVLKLVEPELSLPNRWFDRMHKMRAHPLPHC